MLSTQFCQKFNTDWSAYSEVRAGIRAVKVAPPSAGGSPATAARNGPARSGIERVQHKFQSHKAHLSVCLSNVIGYTGRHFMTCCRCVPTRWVQGDGVFKFQRFIWILHLIVLVGRYLNVFASRSSERFRYSGTLNGTVELAGGGGRDEVRT